MKITIFTPTFNRAYILPKLYESLVCQKNENFTWLIIDDGSADNTKALVDAWIKEDKIKIEYYFQENSGKNMAYNEGVRKTQTEFFTCIDSDDYLSLNAIDEMLDALKKLKPEEIGVIAFKYDVVNNKEITTISDDVKTCTVKEAYDFHGLTGDALMIYKTDVIKRYQFPKFEGEKFVPESYLYDLLDQEGKMAILRKYIVMVSYLNDGYTANSARLLYNNPNGYFCYINNRLKIDRTAKYKFLDSIRYVAMAIAHRKKNIVRNAIYPFWALASFIPGYLFYLKRYKQFR